MPNPEVSQLSGTRVVLRDWRLEDLAPFCDWLHPHHEWHAWDGPYFPRPADAQADQIRAQLGWTEEARFRDARVVRGQPYDSVVYGILRREWLFSGE